MRPEAVPGVPYPKRAAGGGEGRGARTRRAILDAAIARFGREGYRATSVAQIARDADVSATAAYAYFAGKEALFLAAVDEDAAAVISEGMVTALVELTTPDWPQKVLAMLVDAVDRHALAGRLLRGLEPDVTMRVLDMPALADLRKLGAARLQAGQVDGTVRADVEPAEIADGMVNIMLALLMSVVQLGSAASQARDSVAAVLQAAIRPHGPKTD
ncbi:MAG: helix-turn-helix domain containing protein [Actinomycetota bacterium]|nr:helix-turn-helix domain containing protein [Actinomycetota bacterium]